MGQLRSWNNILLARPSHKRDISLGSFPKGSPCYMVDHGPSSGTIETDRNSEGNRQYLLNYSDIKISTDVLNAALAEFFCRWPNYRKQIIYLSAFLNKQWPRNMWQVGSVEIWKSLNCFKISSYEVKDKVDLLPSEHFSNCLSDRL